MLFSGSGVEGSNETTAVRGLAGDNGLKSQDIHWPLPGVHTTHQVGHARTGGTADGEFKVASAIWDRFCRKWCLPR